MHTRARRPLEAHVFALLVMFLGFAACGGGGGGGGGPAPLNPGINLTGSYNLLLTVSTVTGNCPDPIGSTNPQPDVRQVLHDVGSGQVIVDPGTAFAISGKLDGTRVTLTLMTAMPNIDFSTTITFAADGSGFSGTYRQADSSVPCTETGTSVGTKIVTPATPQLNPGVDLTATFFTTTQLTAVTGPCPNPIGFTATSNIAVVHDTAAGTIVIDPGTPDALTGTLDGAVATLARVTPDPAKNFSATVTFAADGSGFTGTATETETGGATPCAQTSSVVGSRGSQLNPGLNLTGRYAYELQVTAVTPGCTTTVGTVTSDVITLDHDMALGTLIENDPASTNPFFGSLNGAQVTLLPTLSTLSASFAVTFSPDGSTFAGTSTVTSGSAPPCTVTSRVTGTRTAGAAVSVKLTWNTDVDLDLAITEPDSSLLNFSNTIGNPTASGGVHSGDRQPCNTSDPREESATWVYSPFGSYQAQVRGFNTVCGLPPTDYVIEVRYDGAVVATFPGNFSGTNPAPVPFNVPFN